MCGGPPPPPPSPSRNLAYRHRKPRSVSEISKKVTGEGFKRETTTHNMAQGKLKVRKSKKKNTLAKRKKEAKRTRIAGMLSLQNFFSSL